MNLHLCFKLIERWKEYNLDNPQVSFEDYLKSLQHSPEDIQGIINTIYAVEKRRLKRERRCEPIIRKIKSIKLNELQKQELIHRNLGFISEINTWCWRKNSIFKKHTPAYLTRLYNLLNTL